ncbi:MAG: glycosyltransferase family 39 protein [Dehalococcoidales bacterium]|nr:glycosyltransferase family 39 protein [Dehalococcoidales bacterium]
MHQERREQVVWLLLALILIGGTLLRVSHLGSHLFHVDEALFASYGLTIWSGLDPLLAKEAVDKPPLFFYFLAASFRVFGNSETAAAMPNLIFSLASVVMVFFLCRQLFDSATALVAAALMAASPFNIAYSYTAFIDPTMVGLALLAMVLAQRRLYFAGGFVAGLLPAVKVQGVLFWPLIGVFGLLGLVEKPSSPRRWALAIVLALAGAALPILGLMQWSALRPEQQPFMELAAAHNPLVPADPATYGAQIVDWWQSSLQYIVGSPLANYALLIGVPLLLAWDLAELVAGYDRRLGAITDWALAAFAIFFIGWHTYYQSPAWDRYMLGLVPVGLILLARVIMLPWRTANVLASRPIAAPAATWSIGALIVVFLAFSLAQPVQAGLRSSYNLGWSGKDGPTTYEGIHAVVNYFKGNVKPGAVLYDYQSLSWHYNYYVFGLGYEVVWFDDAYIDSFQYGVSAIPSERPQYIVLPSWVDDKKTQEKIFGDEVVAESVYKAYRDDGSVSFTIYRLSPAK